jgi:glycerol-3-phosphate O-acyltransferase
LLTAGRSASIAPINVIEDRMALPGIDSQTQVQILEATKMNAAATLAAALIAAAGRAHSPQEAVQLTNRLALLLFPVSGRTAALGNDEPHT